MESINPTKMGAYWIPCVVIVAKSYVQFPARFNVELCERIVRIFREERKRQDLSKYEVEQRAGVSRRMVGYVKCGYRKPSL